VEVQGRGRVSAAARAQQINKLMVALSPLRSFARVNFHCDAATRTGHSLLAQKVQASGGQDRGQTRPLIIPQIAESRCNHRWRIR
jgi:hypothetical protein